MSDRLRRWMPLGLLALALASCSGAPGSGDAGPEDPPDAGGHDAGPADAGRPDAGPAEPDAGPLDAGPLDAGPADAGPADAGPPDAGPPDAGPPDAGPVDAGCLAAPADSCPAGFYCSAGNCLQGCKDGASCGSGVCLGSHDCATCQGDQECAGGRLCGTGLCAATCTSSASCPAGWSCCGQRCIDPSRDPQHCGQCSTTCAAQEFCGQGQCRGPALLNLCQQPVPWVLYDGEPADDAAGPLMAQAIASACGVSAPVQGCGQTDGGVLDPVTGEPLQVGTVLVTAGGSFRQRAVAWLEATGRAPVVGPSSFTVYQYTRADGGVIAEASPASITAWHDIFVVQLVRTPSGSLVLNAAGIFSPGTSAAAWYFIHTMLPQQGSLSQQWYVVDWYDADRDLLPSAGDTWTILDSGT